MKIQNNQLQNDLEKSLTDQLKPCKHSFCEISNGVVKIGQTLEIDFTNCNSSNCLTHDIPYESNVMGPIRDLIESSGYCFQEITFSCHATPLIAPVRFF